MAETLPADNFDRAAELEASLNRQALPRHVGVVMDGNGRWGVNHGMTREYGHRESVDAMRTTVTAADDLQIPYLSLFCFSTENMGRPDSEVASLFDLFNDVLDVETRKLHAKNVRIITSGMVELLPDPLPEKFRQAVGLTGGNQGLTLNLCVMYSGRSEIIEAARSIAQAAQAGQLKPEQLDERRFQQFLFHPDLPDADLVIRTSGEQRISNFLIWQMAYSELVFTDVLWPDFSRADFLTALLEYQRRGRRFGLV
ncbi:di-trans,poly-cis-decaprenylcistransferase [bacterium]|nr:di-trans,poly-cis-decaprenylcistransferase [bacterium]